MPGIEKWFSRYAQLYSRVGFAHEYRPLAQEELNFVLERRWHKLGQTLDPDDFTDAQAIAAVARITRGNFRLIDRLFTQIERVMKINKLSTITDDVIEATRSTLVIGISQTAKPGCEKTAIPNEQSQQDFEHLSRIEECSIFSTPQPLTGKPPRRSGFPGHPLSLCGRQSLSVSQRQSRYCVQAFTPP
ncbi:UNVERIFIED_ORG: hypothetical protein ABIB21_003077 [Arthrobacter sp. UYEF13]